MTKRQINFFSEDIQFDLPNDCFYRKWIVKSLHYEKKEAGELNFIFCNDDYLLPINKQYLNHDTLTDVITFDYVEGNKISGDIFISIERVQENAKKRSLSLKMELDRVIIHGLLHLMGYSDKTSEEAKQIRGKEDFYLALQQKIKSST